jgi:hypothetical protein
MAVRIRPPQLYCPVPGAPALPSRLLRRTTLVAVSLLAPLLLAAPARAADPILPLSQVRAGMQCTALSVVRGLEPASFDVEILDVVAGDPTTDGPRILVRVSGAAVDATGIGPGFSGSPIYCRNADGVQANAGAISESVGEYGGKVALATPIEAILGNPPEAPAQTVRRPASARRARTLAEPLTVSGLSAPLASALTRAAAKRGRTLLAAPAGPLGAFPPQTLRPGSSVGVGYASGDLTIGAIGTVTYVDAGNAWSFGHPLDGVGRRNLLLQDSYVYRVINNPIQVPELASTYKLAAPSHTVGTLSNDALTAVVGRLGALPATVPIRVTATDTDTGHRQSVNSDVADETDVGDPLGASLPSLVAPLAITQGAAGVLKSSPARVSGDACVEIAVRELPKGPLRVCNRYVGDGGGGLGAGADPAGGVTNVVALGAGGDAQAALSLIGGYTGRALHVSSVKAGIRVGRGADIAYMRKLELPRRVRAGQEVTARLRVQRLRSQPETMRIRVKIPPGLPRGSHKIILRGPDADVGEPAFFDEIAIDLGGPGGDSGGGKDRSALDDGPQSLSELTEAIEKLERYDGLELFVGRARGPGRRAYRDPELRLSGRVSDRVQIRPRR